MNARVVYSRETTVDVIEFKRVLMESGLGKVRPVNDEARLGRLISGANLIITARVAVRGSPLVGIARGVTDFSWCCYLSDLAVSASMQGHSIGKGLLHEARRQLGPEVSLILVSMPEAVGFYENVGMSPVPNTFWYRRER
jgi:GNAT superfamily N-acetyltransferase